MEDESLAKTSEAVEGSSGPTCPTCGAPVEADRTSALAGVEAPSSDRGRSSDAPAPAQDVGEASTPAADQAASDDDSWFYKMLGEGAAILENYDPDDYSWAGTPSEAAWDIYVAMDAVRRRHGK